MANRKWWSIGDYLQIALRLVVNFIVCTTHFVANTLLQWKCKNSDLQTTGIRWVFDGYSMTIPTDCSTAFQWYSVDGIWSISFNGISFDGTWSMVSIECHPVDCSPWMISNGWYSMAFSVSELHSIQNELTDG